MKNIIICLVVVFCGVSLIGCNRLNSSVNSSDLQTLADGTKGLINDSKALCDAVAVGDYSPSSIKTLATVTSSGTFEIAGIINYYTISYDYSPPSPIVDGSAISTSEVMDGTIEATVYVPGGVLSTAEGTGSVYFKNSNITVEASSITASFESGTLSELNLTCTTTTANGSYSLMLVYTKTPLSFTGQVSDGTNVYTILPDLSNLNTFDFYFTAGDTTIRTKR